MIDHTRARLSNSLLQFAAERSLLTRELQRRLVTDDPGRPGRAGALAAVDAARAWESMILWLAWRLQPRTSARL